MWMYETVCYGVSCDAASGWSKLNSPHTDHFFVSPLKMEWCPFSYFPLKGEFQTVVLTFVLGNEMQCNGMN